MSPARSLSDMSRTGRVRRTLRFGAVVAFAACGCDGGPSGPIGNGSIHGAVTDNAGAAVANAVVELAGRAQATRTEKSGVDGLYTFAGVPPGTYTIAIAPPSGFAVGAVGTASVTVTAGAEAYPAAFVLNRVVTNGSIQGAVIDNAGVAVANAAVVLTGNGQAARATTSGANGAYTFMGVPAGTYTLTVTPPSGFTINGPGTAAVTVTGGAQQTVSAFVLNRTPPDILISGSAVPGMESYDQFITALMLKHSIPGGAVSVLRDGKLIYARGFGYADVEKRTPVQPDALFRIASVSKPITAAAIMKLVEEGRLGLDDRVAPWIADLTPAPGATVDRRWEQITIRQLLNHTAGWDRDKPNGGFDPMFRPAIAAAAVNAPAPASAETVIRYMKGMPIDFDPGAKHVYSNFGYAILGRVIERASGMPYEDYVRTRVLDLVGATRTRLGSTRISDALADEVKYYLPGEPGLGMTAPLVPSVFPGEGLVPVAYGGFYLEASDASGGWVSSTVDLLRFLAGVDGRANRPDILSAALVTAMTSQGTSPTLGCIGGSCWYALGWLVQPRNGDANWWHGGSLPGTTAILVRSYHNFSWVALFNARGGFETELDTGLWTALASVTSFPTHDLFSTFR